MARPKKIKTAGVYLDKNGTYYLKYKNKTYRGFKTVEEAEIHKAMLRLSKQSLNTTKLNIIVADYELKEANRVKTEEITYGTFHQRMATINKYIIPHLGDVSVEKLTPITLRRFRDDLITINLSSTQKNYIIASLKQILKHAMKYHELKEDLTIFLDSFPTTQNELQDRKIRFENIWGENEFQRFISQIEDDDKKLPFILFFRHGLRLGEAQGLLWENIDFDNNYISIEASITKKTELKGVERKKPKTIDSIRTIYVGETTMNYFKRIYEKERSLHGFNHQWYVLGHDKPYSINTLNRKRIEGINKSGVPYANNHDMRHMFVTNAWSKTPLTALSKYIGHKSVAITLEKYSHLAQDDYSAFNGYIDIITDNSSQNLLTT